MRSNSIEEEWKTGEKGERKEEVNRKQGSIMKEQHALEDYSGDSLPCIAIPHYSISCDTPGIPMACDWPQKCS